MSPFTMKLTALDDWWADIPSLFIPKDFLWIFDNNKVISVFQHFYHLILFQSIIFDLSLRVRGVNTYVTQTRGRGEVLFDKQRQHDDEISTDCVTHFKPQFDSI